MIFATQKNDIDMIKKLINAGANLDYLNLKEQTALMVAAFYGKAEAVETLVLAGANVHCQNSFLNTASSYARLNGHDSIASWLEEKAKPDEHFEISGDNGVSSAG